MKTFQRHGHFFNAILKKNYPDEADKILSEMMLEFDDLSDDVEFAKTSKNIMDRRIGVAGMFLALVKTLDKRKQSCYEKIRKICLEIAVDYVKPKNALHRKIKSFQGKLIKTWFFKMIIRQLDKRIRTAGHPEGFVANIITNEKETFGLGYGIDIHECGICKLFGKHQYLEYAKILCEVDYITSSMSGLDLVRTGTIANGATKCDFRFKQKN